MGKNKPAKPAPKAGERVQVPVEVAAAVVPPIQDPSTTDRPQRSHKLPGRYAGPETQVMIPKRGSRASSAAASQSPAPSDVPPSPPVPMTEPAQSRNHFALPNAAPFPGAKPRKKARLHHQQSAADDSAMPAPSGASIISSVPPRLRLLSSALSSSPFVPSTAHIPSSSSLPHLALPLEIGALAAPAPTYDRVSEGLGMSLLPSALCLY